MVPQTSAMDHKVRPTKANSPDGNACAVIHMQNNCNISLRELITGTEGIRKGTVSMNKSCDRCNTAKRRCDGDGISQCSRCASKGPTQPCIYIKRKPNRPRQPNRPKAVIATEGGLAFGPANSTASSLFLGQNALLQQPGRGQSLKRCRLSPSPATGLVGMQENAFLSDYFGCMGFIPVTCRSVVREAMVKIMCTPVSSAGIAGIGMDGNVVANGAHGHALDAARSAGAVSRRAVGGGNSGVGSLEPPLDAAMCMFWCAVALGGLVRGRPVASVASYIRLAKGALDSCLASAPQGYSATATPDIARALTAMAYLHGFCGDQEAFRGYAERANDTLRILMDAGLNDGLSEELIEAVRHTEDTKYFFASIDGYGPGSGFDVWCHRPGPLLQDLSIGDVITEENMSRFVLQAFRTDGKNFFAEILRAGHCDQDSAEGQAHGKEGEGVEGLDGGCEGAVVCSMINVLCAGSTKEPYSLRVVEKRSTPQFDRLETAVDRPEIRGGIGGLMINGALAFTKVARMHLEGAVERFSRCVEVLKLYPGLLRFTTGLHMAHILATALVRLNQDELYEGLRVAYNPMRPAGTLPMPPLEEWRGIDGICNNIYCRYVGELGAQRTEQPDGVQAGGTCLPLTSDEHVVDVTSATPSPPDDADSEAIGGEFLAAEDWLEAACALVAGSSQADDEPSILTCPDSGDPELLMDELAYSAHFDRKQ